jgi:hypothetical protein
MELPWMPTFVGMVNVILELIENHIAGLALIEGRALKVFGEF